MSALPLPSADEAHPAIHREAAFRHLVEGVQDYAIFMLTPDGFVASWNLGAQRIKGYIAAGKPQAELEIARSRSFSVDVGWRMRRDGVRFWADVTLTALRDRDGALRGFAQITHDLSERRRVEEQQQGSTRSSTWGYLPRASVSFSTSATASTGLGV